ncbi:signal peptide peptidase-like 2B [Clavelina lepadiformis]|uniref:PA domain-containing protein n=1 Tax=Clavelina lepadiformis TaxID=159417 RepID=A0ABP0FFJ8_CLALP
MANLLEHLVTLSFLLVLQISVISAEYGFVQINPSTKTLSNAVDICTAYNSGFKAFPTHASPLAEWFEVADTYPDLGCHPHVNNSFNKKIVIVKRGNCTFAEKAFHVLKANGNGVLIVSDDGLAVPDATREDFETINISVAVITDESYKVFQTLKTTVGLVNIRLWEYAINVPRHIDLNLVIIWFLAVITCAAGAWAQGNCRVKETQQSLSNDNEIVENLDLNVNVAQSILFFVMSSVSILLMYFFYDYLVYVIIVVFCYVSALAMFSLLHSYLKYSPCYIRYKIPQNNIIFLKNRPSVLGILLFLLCMSFSVTWAICRKKWFAWLLQDILGVGFCIYMIKAIRLPNFKICTLLLSLFFVYDVFYVFITPLLTKNNESVMVHVATGGSGKTKEELPMLFKLPKLELLALAKCTELPYSLLGYGDVLLPGLHVGFCATWDFKTSAKSMVKLHSYYIAAVLGYGIGLILTFIAMYVMMVGQPALLYLVPCCLLSTFFVALKRNELKDIWNAETVISTPIYKELVPESDENIESLEPLNSVKDNLLTTK